MLRSLALILALLLAPPALAQSADDVAANRLFVEAVQLWNRAEGEPVEQRAATLQKVESNLKTIIDGHGGSSLAVRLVIGETVGPLSVARVEEASAEAQAQARTVRARAAAAAGLAYGRDCPECPEMVVVPAGSTRLASGRNVTIATPFAVGKFEVTFAEWDTCIAQGGCSPRPDDRVAAPLPGAAETTRLAAMSEAMYYGNLAREADRARKIALDEASGVRMTMAERAQAMRRAQEAETTANGAAAGYAAASLRTGDVSYAVRYVPTVMPGVSIVPVGRDRVFVQAPANHPLHNAQLTHDELADIINAGLNPAGRARTEEMRRTFMERCVAQGGCSPRPDDRGWGRGSQPVMNVSWDDAQQYVAWLSRKTGKSYRLLSEAEWEYAAQAGTGREAEATPGAGQANCDGCGSRWDGRQTAPVGSFPANAFGLHDMLGNVWEWTADCWNDNHAGAAADGSARLSGNCSIRVLRGGSWGDNPANARSAIRGRFSTDSRIGNSGFRVARSL